MSHRASRTDEGPLGRALAIVRRIIGVPDYDAYLACHARTSPGTEPLERDAFIREMLARRYERAGSRCC